MRRNARLGLILAALTLALGTDIARAQDAATAGAPTARSMLGPVDYDFVAEANLGAPFQVDSGRLGERRADTAAIRNYAHLMVTTHIPVVAALNETLQRKGITAPTDTLLRGAYETMIATLKAERGAAFDRDYVGGQVDYQEGNAALFRNEIRNGTDPDLKAFARQTLPKIEDHLQRALKLAESENLRTTAGGDKSS
jgi:putative membrane protein